jgi:hypothetical protein
MPDIPALQDLLNARADEKLKREFGEAFTAMRSFLERNGVLYANTTLGTDRDKNLKCQSALVRVQEVAMEAARNHYREKETTEFLARVEDLADELDALRHTVEEQAG